jgi:ABC-2 type transport system ATP-binding protein
MNQVIIETENLTKKYGDFTAVDGLNLKIEEGEVFGFLGPNGAGKTTTILMLMGLTQPTSGQAKICGLNPTREPVKVKTIVGYLPEKVAFYEDLTAIENLDYTAALNGIKKASAAEKIENLLQVVGLSNRKNEKVGQFSHGMKQRLGIADVMIKDPKVIFFDEPTSGIDPQGVDEMLKLIDDMSKRKITTVISTHQLHQIQAICTRVGIMAKGKIVAEGPISILGKDKIGEGMYQVEVQASPVNDSLINALKNIEGVSKVDVSNEAILVSCKSDLRQQISKAVSQCGATIIGLKMEEYNLHDIYLKYFEENQK